MSDKPKLLWTTKLDPTFGFVYQSTVTLRDRELTLTIAKLGDEWLCAGFGGLFDLIAHKSYEDAERFAEYIVETESA